MNQGKLGSPMKDEYAGVKQGGLDNGNIIFTKIFRKTQIKGSRVDICSRNSIET